MTGGTSRAGGYPRLPALIVIAVLTGAVIGWAALPGRPGTLPAIAVIGAIVAGLASLAQLTLAGVPPPRDAHGSLPQRISASFVGSLRAIPWAEVMTVAVLVLEVRHPARPWHTGLLGVALLGYLCAVHLVETGARASVLRPQMALVAAGLGLLALAVGAAAVPLLPAGSISAIVRVVAVAAAVVAGVLVLPVWLRSDRRR